MAAIIGQSYVWGVAIPLPLVGAPDGARIRLRLRFDDFATAFVKVGPQISQHFLIEKDGMWHLSHARGSNIKSA